MAYEDNPHKVGPPTRGAAPARNVTVRLTHEELETLDAHAERTRTTRAELIREALERMGLFGRRRVAV